MGELDQDFKKIVEQINLELKEAVAALKEANELKSKAGLISLIDSQFLRDEYRSQLWGEAQSKDFEDLDEDKLEEEIDDKFDVLRNKLKLINISEMEAQLSEAGWNTSSSYC